MLGYRSKVVVGTIGIVGARSGSLRSSTRLLTIVMEMPLNSTLDKSYRASHELLLMLTVFYVTASTFWLF